MRKTEQIESAPNAQELDTIRGFSRGHVVAVMQALFVTMLWSSSWVIIKFGLSELTPLFYSGMRYSVASVILLAYVLSRTDLRNSVSGLRKSQVRRLVLYGIVFIAVTQGAQFVALSLLDSITTSMMLNLTPFVVLFLGVFLLKEVPTWKQVALIFLGLLGVIIYFQPVNLPTAALIGLAVVIIEVLANALSSIMGRSLNRDRTMPAVVVTVVSMTVGAAILLCTAAFAEGLAPLSMTSVFFILWLGIVNTALAFPIWNHAMRTLRAIDMTLINSTMLPQITLLAVFILGDRPEPLDWLGLALVGLSALFVQLSQARHAGLQEQKSVEERLPSGEIR